eukprot:Sspe_Gene.18827::Locus_6805_Transcript_1_1_Confidence_1.000_Length_2030::g.18827::m.18827
MVLDEEHSEHMAEEAEKTKEEESCEWVETLEFEGETTEYRCKRDGDGQVTVEVEDAGATFTLMGLREANGIRDTALGRDGHEWGKEAFVDHNTGTRAWSRSPPAHIATVLKEVRVYGVIDAPPSMVYDVLHDSAYRAVWDKNMKRGYNITRLSPTNDVGYYQSHAVMMGVIASRDFCNQRAWVEVEKGEAIDEGDEPGAEYLIMNKSVVHPQCPVEPKIVRGFSYGSGYYLRSAKGGNATEMWYVSLADPKGNVPTAAVNYLCTSLAPKQISSLSHAVKEYPRWLEKMWKESNEGEKPVKGPWDKTAGQDAPPYFPRDPSKPAPWRTVPVPSWESDVYITGFPTTGSTEQLEEAEQGLRESLESSEEKCRKVLHVKFEATPMPRRASSAPGSTPPQQRFHTPTNTPLMTMDDLHSISKITLVSACSGIDEDDDDSPEAEVLRLKSENAALRSALLTACIGDSPTEEQRSTVSAGLEAVLKVAGEAEAARQKLREELDILREQSKRMVTVLQRKNDEILKLQRQLQILEESEKPLHRLKKQLVVHPNGPDLLGVLVDGLETQTRRSRRGSTGSSGGEGHSTRRASLQNCSRVDPPATSDSPHDFTQGSPSANGEHSE